MHLLKKIILVFSLWLVFLISSAHPVVSVVSKPKVVFLNPSISESDFFKPVTTIMQAAASSLGIQLEVIYANRNPNKMFLLGKEIINREIKPDYLVMVNDRAVIPKLMQLADTKKVHTVLFNGALSAKNEAVFKKGESALKYWIGGVLPDEEQAGYLLAESIIKEARQRGAGDDGKIYLLAVNGNYRSYSPEQRKKGLQHFISENSDVELVRIIHAYWDQDQAKKSVEVLLKTYPQIEAIWAASDSMAEGSLQAISELGYENKNIVVCGIDWLPIAFENIAKGKQYCSIGGHLFDGAWLMVLLLDHYNKKIPIFLDKKTIFIGLYPSNIKLIRNIMDSSKWKDIDFRKFSKTYNNKAGDFFLDSYLLLSNSNSL